MPPDFPLDNPVWHSLTSRHAGLGVHHGAAARYRPEISALGAVAEPGAGALDSHHISTVLTPARRAPTGRATTNQLSKCEPPQSDV